MTPRPPSVPRFQRQIPSPLAAATGSTSERLPRPPSLVKAESYEEKSFDLVNFCETLRDSQVNKINVRYCSTVSNNETDGFLLPSGDLIKLYSFIYKLFKNLIKNLIRYV